MFCLNKILHLTLSLEINHLYLYLNFSKVSFDFGKGVLSIRLY